MKALLHCLVHRIAESGSGAADLKTAEAARAIDDVCNSSEKGNALKSLRRVLSYHQVDIRVYGKSGTGRTNDLY